MSRQGSYSVKQCINKWGFGWHPCSGEQGSQYDSWVKNCNVMQCNGIGEAMLRRSGDCLVGRLQLVIAIVFVAVKIED